jgi:orotate phosphoribosyltransferase
MAGTGEWGKQAEFNELVISSGIIGFFDKPVEIKRGMFSNWYVNWRTLASDSFMLDKVTDYIIDFIGYIGAKPRCIYGVPDGATKWAVVSQMKWAKSRPDFGKGKYPVPMGRSKPKEHGVPKDRFFVGEPRGPTLVIEDVTVMGESLINVVNMLKSIQVPVIGTIALTDRDERSVYGKSVKDTLASMGTEYHAMSNAADLLPEALKRSRASPAILRAISNEFAQLGAKRIDLGKT